MMRFRLLGPLEVRAGEDWRGIGAPKWRSVLAALLINPGQIVSADTLISEVWRDEPPARAANLISIYVLRLRRLMDDPDGQLLVTRAPGYQLRVTGDDTDALLFEAMVRDGRRAFAAGDPQGAASRLTEALALWHGRPLADVPPTPLVEAEAERLAELRLGAVELRITAELALGGHDQAVAELRRLLADHPLREGLWLLLMRALDGAGRHAEALEVYGQARDAISEQLGVDPGAELRQLHAELLAKDTAAPAAGVCPRRGDPVTPPLGGAARPPNRARAAAAPRPARPRSGPAQLPADIADFTGRDEQVKRLSDLLSGTGASGDPGAVRIAVVAGAGGLGKTSLAVHAAHRVRRRFPDGQLYVDLLGATAAPLLPGDVLARFLRDLGVDGRDIPVDEDERAARYRTTLARRRMLVVLDNARDAAQVRPLLPGSASSAVLVTTRSRMPDLASTKLVDLNVLDDDEALKLFVKVVGEERAAAEPEATAELLDACAGLPLAIRICAARLVTRSGWTIRAMAGRLSDEHRRLDEMRAGDLAVRASFEVSFTSLPAQHRQAGHRPGPRVLPARPVAGPLDLVRRGGGPVRRPGVLGRGRPGGAGRHAPAGIGGPGPVPVPRPAPGLRRRTGRGRPARGRAGRRGHPPAHLVHAHRRRRRHRRRAAPLQHPAGRPAAVTPPLGFAGAEEALAWYDGERANLVAATRQAAASGLHEIAWRLPAPLFIIFNSRGNWADCIATHRIALDSARQAGNRQGEAWMLNNLGDALGVTRDTEGIGCLERSLAIRREIGDRIGRGAGGEQPRRRVPAGWGGRMRLLSCTGVRWS